MTLKKLIYTCLVALPMASPLLVNAMGEVEPNQPVNSPNSLNGALLEANGVLGSLWTYTENTDFDFYSFYGKGGDKVTIDINNGAGGMAYTDTRLYLFDPRNGYTILRQNDDESDIINDAKIVDAVLPDTGMYIVGVSDKARPLGTGGVWEPIVMTDVNGNTIFDGSGDPIVEKSTMHGDYTLIISGASDGGGSDVDINIEIRPKSRNRIYLNPQSRGRVRVAILSDNAKEFNPMQIEVDKATLTFGETGTEESLHKCKKWNHKDLNGDTTLDLVCSFIIADAKFTLDSEEGILKGVLKDGRTFEGRGTLNVIPNDNSKKFQEYKKRMKEHMERKQERREERMQRKQERWEARMERKKNKKNDDD